MVKNKKKYLSLKEIQKEQTSMLKEIAKFLDKHKFKYTIWAGTLLGAVRHKGFIPWDDDIDLAMEREEYERLVEILKIDNKISKELEAIGFEIGNGLFPFLKVINKQILVEELEYADKNLWIDIFPLDGYSYNFFELIEYKILGRVYSYKKLEYTCKNFENKSKNKLKMIIKKIIINHFKDISYEEFTKKYIDVCKKYSFKNCKYMSGIVWGCANKEKFDKKFLDDYVYLKFENIKVKAISKYDEWLKIRYGNYMELPPKEKRVSLHNYAAYWKDDSDDKE